MFLPLNSDHTIGSDYRSFHSQAYFKITQGGRNLTSLPEKKHHCMKVKGFPKQNSKVDSFFYYLGPRIRNNTVQERTKGHTHGQGGM